MKIVLLIAPLAHEGHYQSWLDMISKLCIENGYKVIYFDNTPPPSKASFLYKLRFFLIKYLSNHIALIKIKGILKSIYKKILYKRVSSPKFNINTLSPFQKSVDVIFFLNLDFLDNNIHHWSKWINSNTTPWAGISLYDISATDFHNRLYLGDPNLKAIFTLKIDFLPKNIDSNKTAPILYLPEITQNTLSADADSDYLSLKDNILGLANGRPIIILCGSIESRKNIRLFLEASQQPQGSRYFFLLAGKFSRKSITQEDQILIKTITPNVGNVLMLDQFFESENTLNSLINLSEYIFAAYVDFDQSSNMLAKSAALRKPILVTKNSYMAYVVKKYGMGYEIDNTIESLFSAIDESVEYPINNKAFDHFLTENNIDKFSEQLLKIFPK